MKKGLLILIVAALVLGLTSCSQDVYSKLGDMMGKMGNNVYGIKPNMAQVEAATQSLDSSVSSDGAGNVSVDLDKASQIISAVATIKDSSQKQSVLKSELSKPIVSDSSEAEAIRDKLQSTVGSIADSIPDVSTDPNLSESQKELINDIKTAIGSVTISDNPTKAELATIAVLDTLAKAAVDVKDNASNLMDSNGLTEQGMAIAESALGSLDTLKVVSEVANIDLLGDLNISSLLGSLGRDVSRDSDDMAKYMATIQVSVSKIFNLMTENGVFKDAKYNSFIAQCKAIKSCYDLAAAPFTAGAADIEALDAILSKNVDLRFTIEDLVSYVVVSAFAEVDKLASEAAKTFVNSFVTENKDALENFGSNTELTLPSTDAMMEAVFNQIGETFDPKTAGDVLLESINNGALVSDGLQILGTATVILVDAEYQSILKLANENGTISGIFSKVAD